MRFPARALLALIVPAGLAMACVGSPVPVVPGDDPGDPAITPGVTPGKTDEYTAPLRTGCDGQALLELDGNVLLRLDTDGTQRELFRLGAAAGVSAEKVVVNQWEVRGSNIVLVGFLDTAPIQYEYVVLDTAGSVRVHLVQAEPYNPTVHLGDDGSLAVVGAEGWIAGADGRVTSLGRFKPVLPVRADGQVLVADGEPWKEHVPHGWLDVATLRFTALETPVADYSGFRQVGGTAVYESGGQGGGIVLATPTRSTTLPIAGDASYLSSVDADARYVLLVSGDGAMHRVDVEGGQLEAVAPWSGRVEGRSSTPALAPGGAVVSAFPQADGALQLRRTTDLGRTWEPVGAAMQPGPQFGAGSHLLALPRGERTLILNLSSGYGDFLDEVQLVSPDRAPDRVAVGGLYVNGDLHPGAADLSLDGSCAATWVQREGTVFDQDARFELVLVEPGAASLTRVLTTTSRVGWLRFVAR